MISGDKSRVEEWEGHFTAETRQSVRRHVDLKKRKNTFNETTKTRRRKEESVK